MYTVLGGVPTSAHNFSPEQLAEHRHAVQPSDDFLKLAIPLSRRIGAYVASSGLGKGFVQDPLLQSGEAVLFRTCTTRDLRPDDIRLVSGTTVERYIVLPP